MQHTLSILHKNPLVKDVQVIKFTLEEDLQRIHLKATLKNNSILFIREIRTKDFEDYSYHWQTKKGKLIARWDNSEHHKHLDTFPHHLHIGKKLHSSKKPSIDDILSFIKNFKAK